MEPDFKPMSYPGYCCSGGFGASTSAQELSSKSLLVKHFESSPMHGEDSKLIRVLNLIELRLVTNWPFSIWLMVVENQFTAKTKRIISAILKDPMRISRQL